jgi:hypothetical protein
MKDARRGKMTTARAQRIMKKTEERSPLPLFSPARKMEHDAGHKKRKLLDKYWKVYNLGNLI